MSDPTSPNPLPENVLPVARLAFRQIEDYMVCFYASPEAGKDDDDALVLGSISVNLIQSFPAVKEAFIALMQQAASEILTEITGLKVSFGDAKTAKESLN